MKKTYNLGRAVGWSNYEEFLKENPTVDASKVTRYIYETLVTYGVTRIVTLPADRNLWYEHPAKDNEKPTFYTTTIRVPGASWGAVPIVGINYDTYIDKFYDGGTGKYGDAKPEEAFDKQALEKAVGNIFTCYISDANGVRATSSVSESGYITFAAYPDILDFMDEMTAYNADFGGMQLIVRGLSLQDLDVSTLYFGPQGFIFAGNGLVEDCWHKTVDISGLSLSASGYLWLDVGGFAGGTAGADFRRLVNPGGDVLVTTTGYLDLNWVLGTGNYNGGSVYAFTYEEVKSFQSNLSNTQVYTESADIIPEKQKDDYYYLLAGSGTYTDYPSAAFPMYVFPVAKADGKLSKGDYSGVGIYFENKFKIPFDVTLNEAANKESKDAVLYFKDKVTAEYYGTYWGVYSNPKSTAAGYSGQNIVGSFSQSDEDGLFADTTFHDEGRDSWFIAHNSSIEKGGVYLIKHQIGDNAIRNGVYLCTSSASHDGTSGSVLNRIGAYLPTDKPDWITQNKWWDAGKRYLDNIASSSEHATIDNSGVLRVKAAASDVGNRVYPNEVVYTKEGDALSVLQTIANNQPALILQVDSCRSKINVSGGIADASTKMSSIIRVNLTNFRTAITEAQSYEYQNGSEVISSTFTPSSDVGLRTILRVKHDTADIYGCGKTYFYYIIKMNSTYIYLASAEVFTAAPQMSVACGLVGKYNPAVPRYKQYNSESPDSWTYNMKTALSHISAREFFSDFGFNIDDYVDAAFRSVSLGKFFQECVIRSTLTKPPTQSTLLDSTLSARYNFYSRDDLHYDDGAAIFPKPTESNPISSSVTISADGSGDFFATAYYTAIASDGSTMNLNDSEKPIWATIAQSRFGNQVTSVSLVDGEGSLLEFAGGLGTIEADKITWLDLLVGLGSGQAVDLLHGMMVRRTASDCNYLITADGTKLYISKTEPKPGPGETIEDGSIGIGW